MRGAASRRRSRRRAFPATRSCMSPAGRSGRPVTISARCEPCWATNPETAGRKGSGGASPRPPGESAVTEMNAGRAVIEVLKAEGVRHIFGIVGSTFLDVLDVLYDDKSVEYVNVRHEQGGAFMADGLARVTGLPAVCLVTSGPGATNLVTGIAGAYVAHSPVIAIAGGVALGVQGRDAFQELDLVALFRPV